MCDKALIDMAPAAAISPAKFNSRWGSLFEYMDMSLPDSMIIPACLIPLKIAKDRYVILHKSIHTNNKEELRSINNNSIHHKLYVKKALSKSAININALSNTRYNLRIRHIRTNNKHYKFGYNISLEKFSKSSIVIHKEQISTKVNLNKNLVKVTLRINK